VNKDFFVQYTLTYCFLIVNRSVEILFILYAMLNITVEANGDLKYYSKRKTQQIEDLEWGQLTH